MGKSLSLLVGISLFLSLALFPGCKAFKGGTEKGDDKKIGTYEDIKYYGANRPGKWKKQAQDHAPECSVIYGNKNKIINVTIPFVGSSSPLHYIETIILCDHNHKELQKVKFEMGEPGPTARFELPADYKSFVFVVAKCNLHDMWESRVNWD